MNSHALQQMMQSTKNMLEQIVRNLIDGKKHLERILQQWTVSIQHTKNDPEETKQVICHRRRLQALRWTLVFTITCIGYKLAKYIVRYRQRRRRQSPEDLYLGGITGTTYNNNTSMHYGNPNSTIPTALSRYGNSMQYDYHYGAAPFGGSSSLNPYAGDNNSILWNNPTAPSYSSYGYPTYSASSSHGSTLPTSSTFMGNSYYNNNQYPGRW